MANTSGNEQGGSQHSEPDSVNEKRKPPRGISRGLKKLKPGQVRKVQWDSRYRPIGEYAHDLGTHIGHIVRTKVSILFEDWKEVPEGMKDSLWQDVKNVFNIDEDDEERLEKMKKVVLHKCDAAFRRFKCDLNNEYIKAEVVPAEPPYVKYHASFSEETWNEFVKIKTTEKAKEISEKATECRKKNKHPHSLGQSSYARKEPEWLSKGYYDTPSLNSVSSSPSSRVVSSFPDRTISWVLARSKPDDQGNLYVPNPDTQEVVTKIDELKKKVANGEFVPNRADDILARALGTKERSGRVRGCGGYTGHRVFWGPSGRCYSLPPPEELQAMIDKRCDEKLAPLIDKLVAAGLLAVDTNCNSPVTPHYSSCQSGGLHDPFANLEGKHSCDLALMVGTEMVIVAEGTVHLDLVFNHNQPLLPGNVTVSVDHVREGYEDSQLPTKASKHINSLGLALGSFTQWPKNLVLLQSSEHDEVLISKKNNSKKHQVESGGHETSESATVLRKIFLLEKGIPCLTEKLTRLKSILSDFGELPVINIGTFKTEFCYSKETDIGLVKEDITQLLEGLWIGAPIMKVFMLAIKDQFVEKFESNSFGFFCPTHIGEHSLRPNPTDAINYMKRAMKQQSSKRFILCPYIQRGHWSLLVLSMSKRMVYTFDPSRCGTNKFDLKIHLNKAFTSYQMDKGRPKTHRTLSWTTEQCAQQKGTSECGYFVIRYMFEIVQNHFDSEDIAKTFSKRTTAYYEDEINDARDILADYLIRKLDR